MSDFPIINILKQYLEKQLCNLVQYYEGYYNNNSFPGIWSILTQNRKSNYEIIKEIILFEDWQLWHRGDYILNITISPIRDYIIVAYTINGPFTRKTFSERFSNSSKLNPCNCVLVALLDHSNSNSANAKSNLNIVNFIVDADRMKTINVDLLKQSLVNIS